MLFRSQAHAFKFIGSDNDSFNELAIEAELFVCNHDSQVTKFLKSFENILVFAVTADAMS